MRGKICFQRSTAKPATAKSGGERRDVSEQVERKSGQGMQGKKLVISLSCKVERGGNQLEASWIAATIWAKLQVRAVVKRSLKDSASKRV